MTTSISGAGGGYLLPTNTSTIDGIPTTTEISDQSAVFIGKQYQTLVQQIQAIIAKTQGGATLSSTDVQTLQTDLNALASLMTNGMVGQDPGTQMAQRYLTTYQASTLQVLFSALSAVGINPAQSPISFGTSTSAAQNAATSWANYLTTPVSQPADQAANAVYISAAAALFNFAGGSPWQSMEAAVGVNWVETGLNQFDTQMTDLDNAMTTLSQVLNNLNTLSGYQTSNVQVQTPTDYSNIAAQYNLTGSQYQNNPNGFNNALQAALQQWGGSPLTLTPTGAYVVPPGSVMDYMLTLNAAYPAGSGTYPIVANIASGAMSSGSSNQLIVLQNPPFPPSLAQLMGATIQPGAYGFSVLTFSGSPTTIQTNMSLIQQTAQLVSSGACTATKDTQGFGNWDVTPNNGNADFVLYAAQQQFVPESVYSTKAGLMQMASTLTSQISALQGVVPTLPDGTQDPSGLTAQLQTVLNDVQTALNGATAVSPPSVWAKSVTAFMTDNAGQNNAGDIHNDISAAQQAGSSLNDQQTNKVQQMVMTFTQFIQIATTVVDAINQLRQTQAQNIRGS